MPILLSRILKKSRAETKRFAARFVYALPLLSKHNPRRRITRFVDHCIATDKFPVDATAHEDWYLPIRPPEILQRNFSTALTDRDEARFRKGIFRYQQGLEYTIPEIFLASLQRATISPEFFVFSSGGLILLESALCKHEILERSGVLDRIVPPKIWDLPGTYCLLGHPWSRGYYHWIVEILPRLAILEKFPQLQDVPLIVPANSTSCQRETLKLAGVAPDRLRPFERRYCRVDRLFFPQILAPIGHPSPHAIAWLRARFLKQESPTKRRLYLSRRDAGRQVLNENEIVTYLRKLDFEVICPGAHSVADQVQMFSSADIVIAPHGAATTNMLFASPGATLIELFGDNYINGCYWAMANICGHRHAFLIGPSVGLDYSIPLPELKALLRKVCDI